MVGHNIRHDQGDELPLPALLGLRADGFGDFRHVPANLVLDDFAQGNVRDARLPAPSMRDGSNRRCRN